MKRIKYTIYTENTPWLKPLLRDYLPGYTSVLGDGCWNGIGEQSIIVTYIAERDDLTVHNLCKAILINGKQDSVYLEKQEIELVEFTKPTEGKTNGQV